MKMKLKLSRIFHLKYQELSREKPLLPLQKFQKLLKKNQFKDNQDSRKKSLDHHHLNRKKSKN